MNSIKWLILGGVFFFSKLLYAGPPFQTDDPDPVPLGHFEFYLFELSDSTQDAGINLEAPGFELNWGAAPDLQLHLVVPYLTNFSAYGGPVTAGISDTELGAKYRLIKESANFPELGIFPFVELATGNASQGLGVGSTWYRLPIWAQKSWGPWTSYGGGGAVITNAPGYNTYAFAGWLLQKQLTEKFTFGGEFFAHAAEGSAATSNFSVMMLDLGGIYSLSSQFQLIFAGGRSLVGPLEAYSYFALYWTWGNAEETKSEVSRLESSSRLSYF